MLQRIIGSDLLLKIAGKNTYQRGVHAFQLANISDFSHEGNKVTATISGYRTELRYIGETGELVEGQCTCPESDGFEFCVHCVQLTLYANKRSQQLLSLSKGPDKSKVMAYLLGLDKQVLAKEMLVLLEQNGETFERYLLRASLAGEQVDFVSLRGRVTDCTRVDDQRNLFSQRQMKAFFSKLDQLTSELEPVLVNHRSEGLKLVEYALKRLSNLLNQIDDKWGFYKTSATRLAQLYADLFSMLEGRDLTLVKRFEKTFYGDQFSLLGEATETLDVLTSSQRVLSLFLARAKMIWLERCFSKIYQSHLDSLHQEKKSVRSNVEALPMLEHAWQWRKLARLLSQYEPPEHESLSNFEWMQSINTMQFTSALAWVEWLDQVEVEHGAKRALEVAREAFVHYPQSEILSKRCIILEANKGNEQDLLLFAKRHPKVFIACILDKSVSVSNLPENTFDVLYKSVDGINPHEDPEEKQYQALQGLLAVLDMHFEEALAGNLASDERLLVDDRIKVLKQLDVLGKVETAKTVREKLVPFLLAKNQNRSDDLAAEQTVRLQANYRALHLSSDQFDAFLHSFAHLIQQRSNFIQLVQKYNK